MAGRSSGLPQTPGERLTGSRLAIKNARILLTSAEALAANRAYGVANSLLIESAEEAVKAGLLAAAGLGSKDAQKNLSAAFVGHKHKHMQGLIPHLPDIAAKWIKVLKSTPPKDLPRPGSPAVGFDPEGIFTWWAHAEVTRVAGFYVDFRDGRWQTPEDITAEDYAHSRRIVTGELVEAERQQAELADAVKS